MVESDLTIDEVDAITGPLLGRAKSATFRTADITGLDVLQHVSKGLSASTGEDFSMPDWVQKLDESGRLGEKTALGSTRKSARTSRRSIGRRSSTFRSRRSTSRRCLAHEAAARDSVADGREAPRQVRQNSRATICCACRTMY
jgi:3-hydroxyacyl-CoA dehydrogenase